MIYVPVRRDMFDDWPRGRLRKHIVEWLEEHVGPRCAYEADHALGMTLMEIISTTKPCSHHDWCMSMSAHLEPMVVFRNARHATLFKLTFV